MCLDFLALIIWSLLGVVHAQIASAPHSSKTIFIAKYEEWLMSAATSRQEDGFITRVLVGKYTLRRSVALRITKPTQVGEKSNESKWI